MAEKNFVVKNGLTVNSAISINSTAFYYNNVQFANATFFSGTANTSNLAFMANDSYRLGGALAEAYVNTSNDFTISGNFTFPNSSLFFGNASVNSVVNSSGFYVNGILFSDGTGGYYKGNLGTVGNPWNIGNLYRVNGNTQSNANITILAGENSFTVGPMTIANGYSLTVEPGGRAVIF